jgi:hypothetical protein
VYCRPGFGGLAEVGLSHSSITYEEKFASNFGYSIEYRCIHAAPPLFIIGAFGSMSTFFVV